MSDFVPEAIAAFFSFFSKYFRTFSQQFVMLFPGTFPNFPDPAFLIFHDRKRVSGQLFYMYLGVSQDTCKKVVLFAQGLRKKFGKCHTFSQKKTAEKQDNSLHFFREVFRDFSPTFVQKKLGKSCGFFCDDSKSLALSARLSARVFSREKRGVFAA